MILALVVVVIAVGLFVLMRRRRSESLREQFGPEYKRAVDQYGDQGKAEAELAAREKRVRKLNIRALRPEERSRFADAWEKRKHASWTSHPKPLAKPTGWSKNSCRRVATLLETSSSAPPTSRLITPMS